MAIDVLFGRKEQRMKVIKKEDYIEELAIQIPLQQAIENNTIDAIPLDKVTKAREEISKSCYKACINDDGVIKESEVLKIIDKLIESEP